MGRVSFFAAALVSAAAAVGCGDDSGVGGDAATTCSTDIDCDDGVFCNGAETCEDLGQCVSHGSPCASGTVCDEAMDRCATDCGVSADADGDGVDSTDCGGTDCDDTDANRFPGNAEVCDVAGHDEDCDGSTFGTRDLDGDGAISAACCNGTICGDDCDDLRAGVNRSGTEACDDLDNDCDGLVDEGVLEPGFVDADRDLHGNPDMPLDSCPGRNGWSPVGDDCDDGDTAVHGAQVEICDMKDNDCDGRTDEAPAAVSWYLDADGDGFGTPDDVVTSCTPVPGHSLLSTDCDDGDMHRSPAATEVCNGIDDDCNGRLDAPVAGGGFEDDDGDGYVDARCDIGTDCDDYDPDIHPTAPELCDGLDNDCDNEADDGTTEIDWYPDVDGDGWGNASGMVIDQCEQPRGHVSRAGDCADSEPNVNPGVPDTVCDGVDQDCDTRIDEGTLRLGWYDDTDGDGYPGGAAMVTCMDPGAGWSRAATDCDDDDDAINVDATETCDGVDQDCDYMTDEGLGMSVTCGMGACQRTVNTCMDGATMSCTPGMAGTEICDGTTTDEDCDGHTDEEPAASASCGFGGLTLGACSGGACTIVGCIGTNEDCNAMATDGCEIDTSNDDENCGACGHRCVSSACVAGRCEHEPVDIALGQYHSCVVLGDGTVWCWGRNEVGQLGDSTMTTRSRATQVPGITDAISVRTGPQHTCALHADGTISCWGSNVSGRLGTAVTTAMSSTPVANAGGVTMAVELSVGGDFTCARLATGVVQCFGSSASGQLGGYCGVPSCPVAITVDTTGIPAASMIDCGATHTLARRSSPTQVRAWGFGVPGQLANGGTGSSSVAVISTTNEVGNPAILDATALAAGNGFSCVVRSDGSVWCTGANDWGQLGTSTGAAVRRYQPVPGVTGAVDVEAGTDHVCSIDAAGQLMCWGRNDQDQVGIGGGGALMVTAATAVTILPTPVLRLDLGEQHSCAVLATQNVVCWGDGTYGQLGDGSTTSSATPRPVLGLPTP